MWPFNARERIWELLSAQPTRYFTSMEIHRETGLGLWRIDPCLSRMEADGDVVSRMAPNKSPLTQSLHPHRLEWRAVRWGRRAWT